MTEDLKEIRNVLDKIRMLSGVFRQQEAVDRLALVNLLTRYLLGDSEKAFVEEVFRDSTGKELFKEGLG
jgi:hypothetical protein